jgi:signal transduction histidine kinase
VEAVTELVTNARKFADGAVHIAIDATPIGGWTYVRLRDDGPGVEPQLAEDAFLPFRLLQPKGRFPGVGMGLPLCRQILRAHGGRCWIEALEPPGASLALRLATAPV